MTDNFKESAIIELTMNCAQVILGAESYQILVERGRRMEEIASVHAIMRAADSARPREEVAEDGAAQAVPGAFGPRSACVDTRDVIVTGVRAPERFQSFVLHEAA